MRNYVKKNLILFLMLALLVPIIWNRNVTVASAATPALTKTTLALAGTGETYDLNIKYKVTGSKYQWTTSNKAVATVNSAGVVTSVGKGTATIKCKITYPSKKTKTLSCKVTVTIPATEISISSPTLVNGAYQMTVGSSIDMKTTLTPSDSTDTTYWIVDNDYHGDPSCISIDATTGKITALKAGKVALKVRAVKTATQEAADASTIDDAVIIEVVEPTATVNDSDIISSNQFKIVFDSPIQASTVIGTNNVLSSNIEILLAKDTKGVVASDPGTLTASLSSDLKTLTITSTNTLSGYYGISVSTSVKTTDGVAIEEYYKQVTYSDTVDPDIVNVTLDDTGVIATINFTEAMNFTNLKVSGAKVVSSATYSATTIAVINNVSNYTASTDKKSLTINLSTIATSDYGKYFTVVLSGLTDLAGNAPANSYLTPALYTDSSQKAQAVPLSVTRTGYYTLTATFSRAIKTAGNLQVSGGSSYPGEIDTDNNKKVNYTLTTTDAARTGANTVSVWGYDSYNVVSTDTSANTMHNLTVNFTTDTTSPVLTSSSFDSTTNILTLTYSEEVSLTIATGTILSSLTTLSEDVIATNLTYTTVADSDDNVIKLQLANMSVAGSYFITLPIGFVRDNFLNVSASNTMTISNVSSASSELPAPFTVLQSSTALNQIYVYFSNKLDKATAETVSNYTIPGVTITSATLTENTSSGGTVLLTVADGSIAVSLDYPIYISGIKGYNGSYTAITSYKGTVSLKENAKPYLVQTTFDTSTMKTVKMIFNEDITGSITVTVTQKYNSTSTVIGNTTMISGNTVYVELTSIPTDNAYLYITVTTNSITDTAGNASVTLSTAGVIASY